MLGKEQEEVQHKGDGEERENPGGKKQKYSHGRGEPGAQRETEIKAVSKLRKALYYAALSV